MCLVSVAGLLPRLLTLISALVGMHFRWRPSRLAPGLVPTGTQTSFAVACRRPNSRRNGLANLFFLQIPHAEAHALVLRALSSTHRTVSLEELLWVSRLVQVPETNVVTAHLCEYFDSHSWVSLHGAQETNVATAELVWFDPRLVAQDLQPHDLTSPESRSLVARACQQVSIAFRWSESQHGLAQTRLFSRARAWQVSHL